MRTRLCWSPFDPVTKIEDLAGFPRESSSRDCLRTKIRLELDKYRVTNSTTLFPFPLARRLLERSARVLGREVLTY